MKRLSLSLLVMMCSFTAWAQEFPVEVIFENGPQENRVNLVFLSDGYKAADLTKFVTDVNGVVNKIFSQSPFKEYKPYFNAYAILVPSNESGAKHPQTSPDEDCLEVPKVTSVDNYFGSTFDYLNIHRLLYAVNAAKIGSVLADNLPSYDQAFVLVNSPHYGGSGGAFATASNLTSSSEVAIHEIGHSFALLADEYWAEGFEEESPNMTMQSNASLVRWKKWIGTSGVGVYPYEGHPTWFRPHQNCKMRFLNVPFCSVCQEAFVERIHQFVNPLVSFAPEESEQFIDEGVISFSVDLVEPVPNTFSITWIRNGVDLTASKDKPEFKLSVNSFVPGENTIAVRIVDATPLTRNDDHFQQHVYEVMWTVHADNVVTGVEIESVRSEYEVEIYPNPVADELNISYTLPRNANVSIELMSAEGKRVQKLVDEKQLPGTHTYSLPSSHLNMNTAGLYYLRLNVDGSMLVEKLIRK